MIKESETRISSALDRMAQTLETLVNQRAPPHEPPQAQVLQDYHPTPHVRDYEEEEEDPDHEEEDPSYYAESRQQAETWEEEEEGIDGYPDDPLGTSTTPSTLISRFRQSSKTTSFSFRMRPLFTMTTLTSSGSS